MVKCVERNVVIAEYFELLIMVLNVLSGQESLPVYDK